MRIQHTAEFITPVEQDHYYYVERTDQVELSDTLSWLLHSDGNPSLGLDVIYVNARYNLIEARHQLIESAAVSKQVMISNITAYSLQRLARYLESKSGACVEIIN